MRRYLRLLWVSLRASLTTAMAYRLDFIVSGFISLWWMLWTLVPLLVVYGASPSVAGWSMEEALLVVAWFTALRGLLEGMINPSLNALVEGIRTGQLDFVLLKPADSQFLVSTRSFVPFKVFDVLAAGGIIVYALWKIGRVPPVGNMAVALVLLAAAVTVLYAIFILVACAAFWVVRLDNLTYLFGSIFDAARWPLQVFRGAWRFVFTFVIPLGVMTTYPAMALLGKLDATTTYFAVGVAAFFLFLSRFAWRRSIGAYTSASS
jgi:ABC-2 type transport system permease protein